MKSIGKVRADKVEKEHGVVLYRHPDDRKKRIKKIAAVKRDVNPTWKDYRNGGLIHWSRRSNYDPLFEEIIKNTGDECFEVYDFNSQNGGGRFADDQKAEFEGRHNGSNRWKIDHTKTTSEYYVIVHSPL